MRIETFSTNNPTPEFNSDSINTINTEISDGQTGIENIAFTTGDNSYDNEDTVRIEEFYTLGSANVYEMAQVVTGTSGDDSFIGYVPSDDLIDFSDHSYFLSTTFDEDMGEEITVFPYDDAEIFAKVIFSKEGDDTFDLTDTKEFPDADTVDTEYTVLAGAGDDTVELPADTYDVEGSYFDGGDGTGDTLSFPDEGDQHIGFSSDNYEDAIIGTNSAFLFATGGSANIDFSDVAYFDNFENIGLHSGDDSVYFGGDPGDSISITGDDGDDTFNFDAFLTSDVSIEGGDGFDTFNITTSPDSSILNLTGDTDDDNFNFSTNISSNITASGGSGHDVFTFNNANITGEVNIDGGDDSDTFKFETVNSADSLTIDNFETFVDYFEFSSSAFSGDTGHTLIFGYSDGSEFFPDTEVSFDEFGDPTTTLHAYDQDDTQINDLLTIDDGYWYYDTVDGSFYYDETADQNMEDAVKIAEVTDNGNALTKDDLSSTDISYNSDTV